MKKSRSLLVTGLAAALGFIIVIAGFYAFGGQSTSARSTDTRGSLRVKVQPTKTYSTPKFAATAVPPPSTSTLPGQSAVESMFSGFSSGDFTHLKTDATTATGFEAFVKSLSPQSDIQIVPSVVSSTANPDGSLAVEFTVQVYARGGLFPTPSIGTLDATVNNDGSVSVTKATLCSLVSPLYPTCPF